MIFRLPKQTLLHTETLFEDTLYLEPNEPKYHLLNYILMEFKVGNVI